MSVTWERNMYEVRYSPESYYVGLLVEDRATAEAVVAELATATRDGQLPGDITIEQVKVSGGAARELAHKAILAWTEYNDAEDIGFTCVGPKSEGCSMTPLHPGECDGEDPEVDE